jgi:hypothetical protein
LLASGCAAAEPVPSRAATDSVVLSGTTLRQEDVTVEVRAGTVVVRVVPLAEAVVSLLAPDTRQRLEALRTLHTDLPVGVGAGGRELFLVSFFSNQPDVPFTAEDLQVIQHGAPRAPLRIAPVTAGWGTQRLRQREAQAAVYEFAGGLAYEQPMIIRYGASESGDWRRAAGLLERERARLRGRGS